MTHTFWPPTSPPTWVNRDACCFCKSPVKRFPGRKPLKSPRSSRQSSPRLACVERINASSRAKGESRSSLIPFSALETRLDSSLGCLCPTLLFDGVPMFSRGCHLSFLSVAAPGPARDFAHPCCLPLLAFCLEERTQIQSSCPLSGLAFSGRGSGLSSIALESGRASSSIG